MIFGRNFWGSYWHKINVFCKIFSGIPYFTIFCAPEYAPQTPYLTVIIIMMIFIMHARNFRKAKTIILMTESETRDWRVGEYPSGRGGMQFWCDGNGQGLGGREKTRIPSASKELLKIRHLIYLPQFFSIIWFLVMLWENRKYHWMYPQNLREH